MQGPECRHGGRGWEQRPLWQHRNLYATLHFTTLSCMMHKMNHPFHSTHRRDSVLHDAALRLCSHDLLLNLTTASAWIALRIILIKSVQNHLSIYPSTYAAFTKKPIMILFKTVISLTQLFTALLLQNKWKQHFLKVEVNNTMSVRSESKRCWSVQTYDNGDGIIPKLNSTVTACWMDWWQLLTWTRNGQDQWNKLGVQFKGSPEWRSRTSGWS